MKKFLLLVILLFSCSKCLALEYTDYSDYSDFTDEYIESNDLTDVKKERRYKYYRLEKEYGPYNNETTLEYPYIDKNDFIDNGFSAFSLNEPEKADNRIIESVKGYHYRKVKDINYLELVCDGQNSSISDLKLYYNNEDIDYRIEKTTDNNILKKNDKIIVYFNQKINLRYLTLKFKWDFGVINESKFNIISGYNDEQYTFETLTYLGISNQLWNGVKTCSFSNAWEDFYYPGKMTENAVLQRLEEVTLYRYKDFLYHIYKFNRIYYDEYLKEAFNDYIYKDETLYKDYYAKRTRTIIPKLPVKLDAPSPISQIKQETQKINKVEPQPEKPLILTNYQNHYPTASKKMSENNGVMFYIYLPFLLILVILILVLSKLYKNKK